MASTREIDRRPSFFWIGSAIPLAIPLTGWILEQAFSQWLGESWSKIPWLWIFACAVCVWVGYFIFDFTSVNSRIRRWYHNKFDICDVIIERSKENNKEDFVLYFTFKFKRHSRNVVVYFQYARLEAYMDGTWGWKKSGSTKLLERRDYNKGEEEKVEILRRSRSAMAELNTPAGKEVMRNGEGVYRLSFRITSARKTQEEQDVIEFPGGEMPRPVHIHPDQLTHVGEG